MNCERRLGYRLCMATSIVATLVAMTIINGTHDATLTTSAVIFLFLAFTLAAGTGITAILKGHKQ